MNMTRGTGNPGMGGPYEQGYNAGMREVYFLVPAQNIYDQPGEESDSKLWNQGYEVGVDFALKFPSKKIGTSK